MSFDLEKRIGSSFILIDSLQSSLVGIMTVGTNNYTFIALFILLKTLAEN